MYLLRFLYQRHRRAVPRFTTVALLGLGVVAVMLPAPQFAGALEVAQPQTVPVMGVVRSNWNSESLTELTSRDRLESREFVALVFEAPPKSI